MTKKLSIIPAILLVINNMLGSGINYMPAAFMNSGYLFSWIFLFGISVLTALSIIAIIISSKNYGPNPSYSQLGSKYSEKFKYFIEFCLIFSSIFTGIAFQKYITNLIVALIPNYYKDDSTIYFLEVLVTLSMSIILFFIVQIKRIADLKFFSYLSVTCVVSLIALLSFCNIYLSEYLSMPIGSNIITYNYTFSISYFIFALCCQSNMVELYGSLKNKKMVGILIVSICAPLFGFIINGFAGFLGYRLIGNLIGDQDIIKIFADNSSHINQYLEEKCVFLWYALKIQSFFAILVLVSGFPMQVAPAIASLKRFFEYENPLDSNIHRFFATLVIFFITAFNCIPNINPGKVLELLSITSDNFISFLFPFLFLLIHMKNRSKTLKIFISAMLIPSIFLFVNGFYEIISGWSGHYKENNNATTTNIN